MKEEPTKLHFFSLLYFFLKKHVTGTFTTRRCLVTDITIEYNWVRNPFAVTTADTKHLSLKEAEELAELQADGTTQLKFRETLPQFWNLAKNKIEFSVLSECAPAALLHFSTTCLCEQGFSGLA
jgi:hypothetical protein